MFHLDTDFLIHALTARGPERDRVLDLTRAGATLKVSTIVWYEFCRGPRTPGEIALATDYLGDDAFVPFSRELAERAADVFRALGSPRKRGIDVAIAVFALADDATLLTRNERDFKNIDGLKLEVVH